MANIELPPDAWDCHVHVFDPERFPYSPSRAYTPQPARLDALAQKSLTRRVMVVQASIEGSSGGLLAALTESRQEYAGKLLLRGTIHADPSSKDLESLSLSDLNRLHAAGIRGVRIHGTYGGQGNDVEWVRGQFRRVAAVTRHHGWTISAQLPLQTWAALGPTLLDDLSGVDATGATTTGPIVLADHCGSISPSDIRTPAMDAFVGLLQTGLVFVKLGAVHRRVGPVGPDGASAEQIRGMREVIQHVANEAPQSLLWGSDWPHIDARNKGPITGPPFPGVDTQFELGLLKEWLTKEQWYGMLVTNPQRLFN